MNDLNWDALEQQVIACRLCPRLVEWREQVAQTRKRAYRDQEYWGKPVPGFGDRAGRVLVVGLAPGAHGSNRTGRMFTGDGSGDFLYPALYRAGFASQPTATGREDGMLLRDLFISAVGRCAPPQNKPTPGELRACRPYLEQEMTLLKPQVIVALGRIAFDIVLDMFQAGRLEFAHGAAYSLGEGQPTLVASYHPSRQNTQTRRLTVEMFDAIWTDVARRLR